MNQNKTTFAGAFLVLLFMFFATFVILKYFLNISAMGFSLSIFFVLGLGILIVYLWVVGYSFPALIGVIIAVAFWIADMVYGIINMITNPFSQLGRWLGLDIVNMVLKGVGL
jgi:glucan phosphoethanolaminetransferase (alkaline phosphatase superfamily)